MKAQFCTDCGYDPVWWWCSTSKCRHCYSKGGGETSVDVDVDLVLESFGGDEAKTREFLSKVRSG
jgi:hypothetical protein